MTKHKKPENAVAATTIPSSAKTQTASTAAMSLLNPSVFDSLADSAFLREAQLVPSPKRPHATPVLPFSAATLWRKVNDGSFPKPVRLSERVTAWRVGDVRTWFSNCGRESQLEPFSKRRKRERDLGQTEQSVIPTRNTNESAS